MTFLQIAWFVLILVLLTGYAILDGFDLGVGFWNSFLKDKKEKENLMDAIGPFWDGNEVWLLTGGGAVFAAFPPVYATTFSAFYFAMMLVIFSLIFRALSIEFRNKIQSVRWYKIWDISFTVGSVLASILFGVAIGNIITGIPMDSAGNYTAGFFDLVTPFTVLIGLTTLMMFVVHGATFLKMKVGDSLKDKVTGWIGNSWYLYIILLVISLVATLVNYQRSLPAWSIALAVLSVVSAVLIKIVNSKPGNGLPFAFSTASIVFNMVTVATSIFPFMVFNTKSADLSLTIYNASASQNTLTVMFIMALIGMPVVIFYTAFVYRVFSGKQNNLQP